MEIKDKKSTILMVFSTITGNAFKLAEAVAQVVPDYIGPYNIKYIKDEMIEEYDTFILSYWCNKGTADNDTIELIQKLRNKKLILIGTLGVARDSKHTEIVSERVKALASENNTLIGHFLCQGSVDLKRSSRRLSIPEGQKGHLTQERFERQKLSQGHPDAIDLADAQQAVKGFLINHGSE